MCAYPHSVPDLAKFCSHTWPRSDSNGDYVPYIKSLDMGDESRYGTVLFLSQGSCVAGWNILLFVLVCFVYICSPLVFNIMCSSRTCSVFYIYVWHVIYCPPLFKNKSFCVFVNIRWKPLICWCATHFCDLTFVSSEDCERIATGRVKGGTIQGAWV